jgi:hypothetical protein
MQATQQITPSRLVSFLTYVCRAVSWPAAPTGYGAYASNWADRRMGPMMWPGTYGGWGGMGWGGMMLPYQENR